MRALITGCTGQDGRLLAPFLLDKGYEVFGLIRGQNNPKRVLIDPRVSLIEGDLTDYHSLEKACWECLPNEVYNLAAISHVGVSFKQPELTANVTGLGCLRLLQAVNTVNCSARFYQASTSELFGKVRETPQTELTPFYPRSPYGSAKAFAHYTTVNYRESYGLHASCGILFNHESIIRGYEFVTRKVTQGVARIQLGMQGHIELGNLTARRDWGNAEDFIEAMWLMLQQEEPGDYIIATNTTRSIADLLTVAFAAIDVEDWSPYIKSNQALIRPAEVDTLRGDYKKAFKLLGWYPKTTFEELITTMVRNDLKLEKSWWARGIKS